MTSHGQFPLRLYSDGARPNAACGVVLVRVSADQFHLGLRYDNAAHEPVVHFAWHRDLRNDPLRRVTKDGSSPSAVITLPLDPAIDGALQFLAEQVVTRYVGAPDVFAYSFGEVSATFDRATGELSEDDVSFTCATFVLTMLRSVGAVLLDISRWPGPTHEDRDWQRKMETALLESIHGELLRAKAKTRLEQDFGSRRYRPTDVAGASLFHRERWPLSAEEAEPRARELMSRLPWPNAAV